MRMGALLGPIVDASQSRLLAEQARMFEGEGYTSLWSAQAIGRGFMVTDPLIALSVAATVTDEVEIGTAILQVPLYHPMDLAHRVLSLQQLCGDRLVFGVGAGSTEADFKVYERDFKTRFAAFNEALAILRETFAEGGAQERDLSPWPAVLGGPRIYFGTWGNGVERAAREFDGWIASGMYREPEALAQAASRYFAAGGGRAIVSTVQVAPNADLGELKARFQQYAEAGFHDVVVMLLPGGPAAEDVRSLLP